MVREWSKSDTLLERKASMELSEATAHTAYSPGLSMPESLKTGGEFTRRRGHPPQGRQAWPSPVHAEIAHLKMTLSPEASLAGEIAAVNLVRNDFGPLTMACFNPARDVAPRVFSALADWGAPPFTVNGAGWFTVYILAPVLGGLLGGGINRVFFKPAYETHAAKAEGAVYPEKDARPSR